MAQYTINNGDSCFNTKNYFLSEVGRVANSRSQILTWLSPLEPKLRHREVEERRVDNVGEWLTRTEEFRKWSGLGGDSEGNNPVLFCYGDPGVGKTFISSLVVDRLCDQKRGQKSAVGCFYFDFETRKEQSAASALGSLLKQIVNGMETMPEEISRAFSEQRAAIGGRGLQLVDIVKMLQTITSSRQTFMCIDALDECWGIQRARLLDSLKQIIEKSPSTRMFMTGRPHLRNEVEKRLARQAICIPVVPTKGDINGYLRARMDEDETPDAMDETLEVDILEKVPKKLSDMFLLISLNTEAILQESTIYQRVETLNKITDGLRLGAAYGPTIERIKEQGVNKSRLGMDALMWVSHAERPLKAVELCHALAIQRGSTKFNANKVPSISTVVGCCQGLITLDNEESTVRLVHFTLQKYLSSDTEILQVDKPHSTMAEICLTYLKSKQVKAISADTTPSILDTPFLEYCSIYWGVHARRGSSAYATSLALELFQEYDGHISTKFLLEQVDHLDFVTDSSPNFQFTRLHCASFFGIDEVLAALLKMECYDTNEGDLMGYTPLAWAAYNGHDEAVNILLARAEVNPDKPNHVGQTPLSHAAWKGQQGVVKILLEQKEVNPDKPDNHCNTPLLYASMDGHEEVVKILLGRKEVDPDKPNKDGNTPLSCAARNGHQEVVKVLLRQGEVNPDSQNYAGGTPLLYAAWKGQERVVKILLERENVDPDKADNYGCTPLLYAAWDGQEGVVRILLGQEGVNPDRPNYAGSTPLSYAAAGGNEHVVKMLLEREEVNPEKLNNHDFTPLACAAGHGHEGVVKVLLEKDGINRDKPNNYGRTPLSYAASNGHEGVVKILLGWQEVNPNRPDNYGQTPLMYATRYGHQKVIELLQPPKAVAHGTLSDIGNTTSKQSPGWGSLVERLLVCLTNIVRRCG